MSLIAVPRYLDWAWLECGHAAPGTKPMMWWFCEPCQHFRLRDPRTWPAGPGWA